MSKEDSLSAAFKIFDSVRGRSLSMEERKSLSIELAALILREAEATTTSHERSIQEQLSRLMNDSQGKAFTTALTDECFRSTNHRRVADQMIYLLSSFGIPRYLHWFRRLELFAFRFLGPSLAQFLVPLATSQLRKETARVILPGEEIPLSHHLEERKKEGVQLNLNHLGEAILSEHEASKRFNLYIKDLQHPQIDYISVKISTIFSQINLVDFEGTVRILSDRLRILYRTAMQNPFVTDEGIRKYRFVNLDMEEYRDLHLTVAAFKQVLEEPEFQHLSAGIVLQAYLPDAHPIQRELTEWAKKRLHHGGAPIKIRIVKGANLAMEQFEASLRGWAQAPYFSKVEVDSNYKRMVIYGCTPEHARAVRLGIASHNLFDISFAILLRLENRVEPYVGFEMLEGMADPIRRVVQRLTQNMLLYCPIATKEEFQHAIAYLVRRLDENTGPENFLRYAFGLKPGTKAWEAQCSLFSHSCDEIQRTSIEPRRKQNRLIHPEFSDSSHPFDNEPDTDFSLPQNRRFAADIIQAWKDLKPKPIPLVVEGKEVFANEKGEGFNPASPEHPLYVYAKAHQEHIENALACAKAHEREWAGTTVAHRCHLLAKVAQKFRERRNELIGVMMIDGGKTILEADPEVSEAIDFAEYYLRMMEKMSQMRDLHCSPKGTILVASPWNFPCAIPAGGILAALVTGNCVLFKPSSDAVLVGWHVAKAIWDAGIPKEVLQFIPCSGEQAGSQLITDSRVNCVILTGGTSTARKFLKLRPDLDLAAETGGKNAIVVTALADRDLAIKDLVQSAFGHNGQKCSAASLAILEAEIYDDPSFLNNLKEAVRCLKIGPAHDPSSKITPLINEPKGSLLRGFTTLDEGESWLLEPKRDTLNHRLWSPGIKIGVCPGSFMHQTELFGPVLGVMRADSLKHAIDLANGTPYGLTSGLQSLDQREHSYWLNHIEAGNLYINRTITGAIVRRQPFGGTKASSFGNGSKAGGPNYLREFLKISQISLPQEKHPIGDKINALIFVLKRFQLSPQDLGVWTASIENYAYWWRRLNQTRDSSKIIGQDNFFRYFPRKMCLRITPSSSPLDILRSCAAALTVGADLTLSSSEQFPLPTNIEDEAQFLNRVRAGSYPRIRLCQTASHDLKKAAIDSSSHIIDVPVLANGRFELLHYLREVSISSDYHRYGNLGLRENEIRKPLT